MFWPIVMSLLFATLFVGVGFLNVRDRRRDMAWIFFLGAGAVLITPWVMGAVVGK